LGGYGLDGAIFNHEITLKEEGHTRLAKSSCFTDLYYAQAKLAVEYDSFKYHGSPSKQGEDAMRASILERQGIDVMHMGTIQLYNKGACKDFAYNLAARLGKRMQIRIKKFDEKHTLLRSLLPVEKTFPKPEGGDYNGLNYSPDENRGLLKNKLRELSEIVEVEADK
jgi:hypothetical protein